VESANKLVVEARLQGAGIHWARHNVNPLLALRNTVCNDRWAQTWPQIEQQLRQQTSARHCPRWCGSQIVYRARGAESNIAITPVLYAADPLAHQPLDQRQHPE
jgi:hypothetical protein